MAKTISTAPARNSATEPCTGTAISPCTTMISEKLDPSSTTSPIDQIFDNMISVAVTGMTSRCSTVPCSFSRISAAPVSTRDSMVIDWITLEIAPNHFGSSEGL